MKRPDFAAPVGLLIGFVAIATAATLEGIKLAFLFQPTAALIVVGGTLGAVVVRRGMPGMKLLAHATRAVFFHESDEELNAILSRLGWLARKAKHDGIKVFESYAESSEDPLVVRALTMAAEYQEPEAIRESLDKLLDAEHDAAIREASTLEAAASYAPTFGILGAVLGLIHVLRSLDDPTALGTGIATAFVATIYGLMLANLILFPLASRMRERHEVRIKHREGLASALVALASNASPTAIANQFAMSAPTNEFQIRSN